MRKIEDWEKEAERKLSRVRQDREWERDTASTKAKMQRSGPDTTVFASPHSRSQANPVPLAVILNLQL